VQLNQNIRKLSLSENSFDDVLTNHPCY